MKKVILLLLLIKASFVFSQEESPKIISSSYTIYECTCTKIVNKRPVTIIVDCDKPIEETCPKSSDGIYNKKGIGVTAGGHGPTLIELIPNPVNDNINVSLNVDAVFMTGYEIFNFNGNSMMQGNIPLTNNYNIDISALPSDYYIIYIYIDQPIDGSNMLMDLFIKE